MITINVQCNNNYADIDFPCSDTYIREKYRELGILENISLFFVKKIIGMECLSVLENRFVDLDQFNYLAKRLDGLDKNEMKKFEAVVKHYKMQEIKDLINLTFNLQCYTLVQDFESMEKVGRVHILDLQGGLGLEEEKNYDFTVIGKELINSGKGIITESGILFQNDEIPFDEVYDGQVFPEYVYEECLLIAEITYKEKSEYVYLPCEELSIKKALSRLAVLDIKNCYINIYDYTTDNREWFNRFNDILQSEGLYSLNQIAYAVNGFIGSEEWEKLSAVAEYANVSDSKSLILLARKLDSFIYIPNIQDQEELARHWIEHNDEYELSPELEDYFLYDQFGEQLEHDLDGKFTDMGYVYTDEGQSIDEILEASKDIMVGEKITEPEIARKENMIIGGM